MLNRVSFLQMGAILNIGFYRYFTVMMVFFRILTITGYKAICLMRGLKEILRGLKRS